MINRSYFYNSRAQIGDHSYKSPCGVVTVKSWFPKPVTAFKKALDAVMESTGIAQDRVVITKFYRVK